MISVFQKSNFLLCCKLFSKNLSKAAIKDRFKVVANKPSNIKDPLSDTMKSNLDANLNLIETKVEKDDLIKNLPFEDYISTVDSTFESFFLKREYSLENFNFYLQVLAKKSKPEEALKALKTMEEIGIAPNETSYNMAMTAFARKRDIEGCEKLMKEIEEKKLLPTINTYSTLLNAYANNGKHAECEGLIREINDIGLKPTLHTYTALIKAYKNAKMFSKCWEIYENQVIFFEKDEYILSEMVHIASYTKDAEKALNIWDLMQFHGMIRTTTNYNHLLSALASRFDYSSRALEVYQEMDEYFVPKNKTTFVFVLKAISKMGDVRQANEIVKEIKLRNIPVDSPIMVELLHTYASAVKQPISDKDKDIYVRDAFEIFGMIEESVDKMDVRPLNGILSVCCGANRVAEVDGLVLPLFAKHGCKMTPASFEQLAAMFVRMHKHKEMLKLFKSMEEQEIPRSMKILNFMLESSIARGNSDGVLACLRSFKEIDKVPHAKYLRKLGSMVELPDEVYMELLNFPMFGSKNKKRRSFKRRFRSERRARIADRRGLK